MSSARNAAAASVAGVSLALMGWSLVALTGSLSLPDAPDPVAVFGGGLAMAMFPLVGLVIAVRQPRHPIGWLFLVAGLGLSLGVATEEYVTKALDLGVPLPAVELVAWIGEWAWVASFGLGIPLSILLFPEGRRTGVGRALVVLTIANALTTTVGAAFGLPELADGRLANPFRAAPPLGPSLNLVHEVANVLMMPIVALAIVDFVIRAAHSTRIARQQFKWFGSAVSVVLVGVALSFPGTFLAGEDASAGPSELIVGVSNLGWSLVLLGVGLVPLATGAAILRFRLFDIDRIVSRTVAWTLASGILAAVFAAAVLGLQAALATVTQGETLAVAASTLLAFVLFQPVRRRVQQVVDRRFDRARYDAEQTVSGFAGRLRDEVDPDTVRAEMIRTVGATFHPTTTAVWFARPGASSDRRSG